MYGKIENGIFIPAPRKLHVDNTVVYNPADEMLITEGYKPVEFTEPPAPDEAHVPVPVWTEADGKILQQWRLEEVSL